MYQNQYLDLYDFEFLKNGDRIHIDSGYQRIQHIRKESEYLYKKNRNGELSDDEKEYNTVLSRIKIMADRYSNEREKFNEKLRIIAWIVNLKSGFGIA
ncbi:MAG: transposase family protein [Holosporales bacterium]|jgi:carbonic anhydrase|nr:transposase family protein [Holosporales bacterium]